MIRAVALLAFWGVSILIVGPPLVLFAALTGNINPLYNIATRLGIFGVRLVGVKIVLQGMESLRPGQNYIFMSNHVSNLDPPVLVPSIPGRCSVLVKKELFRTPILGTGMHQADLVPVDRSDREAAIESVRAATEVLKKGLHMVIYPEGNALERWTAAAFQERPIPSRNGLRRSGDSGYAARNLRKLAEAALRVAQRNGDGNFSFAD